MLTGLDLSHVPLFLTDLILGSFAGGYSQTCIKRSLTKIPEIISLKHESGYGHFFQGRENLHLFKMKRSADHFLRVTA